MAETVTVKTRHGWTAVGDVRCWYGGNVVEVETEDGHRYTGVIVREKTAAEAKT